MSTKTLVGPQIKTALPGPNAKRVLAGDDQYLSPSYTRSYPLVAEKVAASSSPTWMEMNFLISQLASR